MKTDVIKIRIDSDVKAELEKIATSEQRTLAGQIRLALQEWINQRGASCAKTIRAKKEPEEPAHHSEQHGQPKICPHCSGIGALFLGFSLTPDSCPHCHGTGKLQ